MVTKSKAGENKGKVKLDKLKLNKETVKELSTDEQKQVKGGLVVITIIGIIIGPLDPPTLRCALATRSECR
jgi:hypothetical protein